MKRVLSCILSLGLLASVLTACGSPAESNSTAASSAKSTSTTAAASKVTWLCARPEDGAIVQTVKELATKFAQTHPGFSLDVQVTADRPSYLTKLRTLIAAGTVPEFLDTDADPYCEELVKGGYLANMEDFLKEQKLYDKFYTPALKYQELPDGSLYLLPLEYQLEMTWYNKDMFKKNNLSVPTTMDEWLNVCKIFKSKGTTPIAVDGTDVWPVLRYAAAYPFRTTGNTFIRSLSQGKEKMASATGMQAANFVAQMGQYFQKGFATTDYTTAKNMFLNGEVPMYWMGTWETPSFTDDKLPEKLKGKVGYFYLPSTTGAKTGNNEFFGNSGIGFGCAKASFNGVTKEFVEYLINNYSDIYVAKQQMSPIKFTIKDKSKFSDLFLSIKNDADNYGQEFAKPWDTLLDADTNTVMGDQVVKLAMGSVTPEQFAKTIDDTIAANVSK